MMVCGRCVYQITQSFHTHLYSIINSGMPSVNGLRAALARVNAAPGGTNKVFWTSLREEPVLYVAGRPHVLRLMDRPLENVE